jgi:hypothetical protein
MVRIIGKVFLLFTALAFAVLASAQGITTGTVAGTVSDPSGAVIPNARVQLTNKASGLQLEAVTTGDGSYRFAAVPLGTYTALVKAQGFSTANVENIAVTAGATTNIPAVRLAIGATEQIEVNGSTASLLETTDSQVTTNFSTETVQNLPLNNGFDTIAEVIPGVVSTGADNFSNTNGDNFSVNGQSGRYNNFEIDGQANNDNSIGGPAAFFGSQDAIEEIQVITNDYSAQYGRNAGAVVNYLTRAGTNSFHGSAFELYQDEFLSSMTNDDKNPLFGYCAPGENPSDGCAPPVLPRYVENRVGGTVGGPIWRNKLFFFASTFWDRVREGATPSESLPQLTPDPTGLATIKSAFSSDPGALALLAYSPYTITAGNPQPIPGTAQLETLTDGNGNTANVEVAGIQRTIPSIFNDQEELDRIDWQPTAKDHLFARYFYQPDLSTGVEGVYTIAAGDFLDVPSTTYSIGADWTHSFNTNLVDQLRYSYQESKVYFEGGAYANCVTTDFGACPAQVNFTGTNNDSPFGGDIVFPQGRTVKVTQVQDNATWTHKAQTLLFGGEVDYQNSPNAGLFYYSGEPNYGTLSNLLGTPDPTLAGDGLPGYNGASPGYTVLADGNTVVPFTEPDVAAYFQDDWKIIPTLTLHVGVRWEFFGQAANKLAAETVARESNPSTAFWDPSLPLAQRTVPQAKQIYTNFEPRIGLAWNPDADKKLVVRAGYAINANPAFYNMFLLVAQGAPAVNAGAFACANSSACVPSSGSLLSGDFRATNLPSLPTGGNPAFDTETSFPTDFRTPYVQTYTLGVEHQLGSGAVMEVRYTGAKTTHDFQSTDYNPELLPVAQYFPRYVSASSLCADDTQPGYGRPNCAFGNVSEFTNGGWANYNALELNVTTKDYRGLTSTWSYTRSKAMNNSTDPIISTGGGGVTVAYAQNPLNTDSAERGLSGNDFPNTVGIGFTYNLPKFVEGGGVTSKLANGFMLSGLYRYHSGQVYTPYQPLDLDPNTGDTSFCDGSFNSAVLEIDTCRLVVSNRKAPLNSVAYLNAYVSGGTGAGPVPGTPHYIVYGSDSTGADGTYSPGTPIDPKSAYWIVNNQAYALSVNNPYPGWGRSPVRGQTFSDLDATLMKSFAVTERLQFQLSMAVYNVLNQMFLGDGNPNVSASNFTSNAENASGSVPGDTSGNRFVILGGKIVF